MQFINLIIILLFFTGCAPVFNEFQGADTVGQSNTVVTPYFSDSKAIPADDSDDSDISDVNSTMGIRIAYGLSDRTDIHLKLEKIDGNGGFVSGSLFSLGFKYFLYNDKVDKYRASFYLPLSYASRTIESNEMIDIDEGAEDQSYILIEPTIIASSQLHKLIDLNVSTKFIQKIGGDKLGDDINDYGISFNLSSTISLPEISGLSFIPEYGILFWGDDKFTHTGFGVNVDLSKFKN